MLFQIQFPVYPCSFFQFFLILFSKNRHIWRLMIKSYSPVQWVFNSSLSPWGHLLAEAEGKAWRILWPLLKYLSGPFDLGIKGAFICSVSLYWASNTYQSLWQTLGINKKDSSFSSLRELTCQSKEQNTKVNIQLWNLRGSMKERWNHPSSCCSSSGLRKEFLCSICTFATRDSSVWPRIIIPRLSPAHRPSMSSVKSSGSSWAAWDSAAWPSRSPPQPFSVRLCSLNTDVFAGLQLPLLLQLWGLCSFWSLCQKCLSLTSILTCPNPAHSSRLLCSCILAAAIPKLLFLPQGICLPAAAFPDASRHLLYCANQRAHHLLSGVR